MSDLYPILQIDVAHEPDACVVRLSGELDLAGCPALEGALMEAEASRSDRILLDLDQLTFADSSGLTVLHNAGRRSNRNGGRLRLTRGNGQVADMFRLTALDLTLPFADAPRE